MKRTIIMFSLLSIFACVSFASVAGQFYPADKGKLSSTIDGMLKPYKLIRGEGELLSIIVPHAGYEYSGHIAAYAYKQLTNKSYDTVIVIGPSHYFADDLISVMSGPEYSTPLGKLKVDTDMVKKIMAYNPKIKNAPEFWQKEHSVDVQVPFLQKTLNNFKIVPIFMGTQSIDNSSILAEAIIDAIGNKKVLIVASSDLSHYHTAEVGNAEDALVVKAVSNGDINLLVQTLASGSSEMCGYGPVITAMLVSDRFGANSYEVLNFGDSGDVTGDKSSVVGYLSAAIYKRPVNLDDTEKTRLLDIARSSIMDYLDKHTKPDFDIYEKDLMIKAPVFVTLTNKKELRGCIGHIRAVKPLYMAVSEMAIEAATNDLRFTPVTTEEMSSVKIEISVLSTMTEISGTKEVVVGRDGLFIVNGGQSGLLLPQVALENNWNKEQLLDNLAVKAGLAPKAWRDPASKIYKFTANVFGEGE